MNKADKFIKSYEPMMHLILRRFKVRRDYEDILQMFRIRVWEEFRDSKYNKLHKTKKGKGPYSKLSSYIYLILTCYIQDILKVSYRVMIKDRGKDANELPINKKIPYFIENPDYYLELSIAHQTDSTSDASFSAAQIRCKLDFEIFCNSLSKEDKEILRLSAKGLDKAEIGKECKRTERTIYRRLVILKLKYKKYLIEGEL